MHFDQATGPFDETQWRKNWATAEEYIDFSHYNIWIPAQSFTNDTGSTTTMTERNDIPVRAFPDAVDSDVFYVLRRPRMWINGVVSARVWYTGKAEDTPGEVIRLFLQIFDIKENVAPAAFSGTAENVPAPTVSGMVLINRQFEVQTARACNQPIDYSSCDLLRIGLRREGSSGTDTYAGDSFELIGLELFYKEKRHSALGWKSNGFSRWLMKS